MKNIYIKIAIFAFLATSMAACSSDEELNDLASATDNNAICFKVQTPNLSRAADSYNNNSRPTRFNVTAYHGKTNYFGGSIDEMASADGGYSWSSDHTRFWPTSNDPSQNSLTFYAFIDNNDKYSRAGSYSTHSFDMSGNIPMFKDFTIATDVSLQKDLMYAVAKDVCKPSKQKGDVTLNFRHALSQICFTAQNNDPSLNDIEIIAIEIGGIKGKGTYRFPDASTSTLPSNSERTAALGEWIIDKNAENQTYRISDLSENLGAPDITGKGRIRNISNPDYSDGMNARKTNDFSNAMYLIPQKVAACSTESAKDGAYFKVTVKVYSKVSMISDPIEVFVPVAVNWQEGNRYVYNLVWEGSGINYDVNIADYQDVNY